MPTSASCTSTWSRSSRLRGKYSKRHSETNWVELRAEKENGPTTSSVPPIVPHSVTLRGAQECPIARHSPLPELQALVSVFRPQSVSPNCVVPTLAGLDYFLLPSLMDGLLQPDGVEHMVEERDAWFRSDMCFVRNGPVQLADMKQSQAKGLDLLQSIDNGPQDAGLFHDYLPFSTPGDSIPIDAKVVLGGSRRHVASDQAMRAGCIVGSSGLLPAFPVNSTPATSHQAYDQKASNLTGSSADDMSDTDNEGLADHQKRVSRGPGKRKHLVSPSQARSRVLSMHRHNSTKRAKTGPSKELEETSTEAIRSHGSSNRAEPITVKLPIKPEPYSVGGMITFGRREGATPPSKYLVDSIHLAALMAVGDVPSSP